MALYHVHAQVVSRASGASAVAGAAYRSRDTLTDERTGEEHDYRNRRDDLDGSEILTPRGSPAVRCCRRRLRGRHHRRRHRTARPRLAPVGRTTRSIWSICTIAVHWVNQVT